MFSDQLNFIFCVDALQTFDSQITKNRVKFKNFYEFDF